MDPHVNPRPRINSFPTPRPVSHLLLPWSKDYLIDLLNYLKKLVVQIPSSVITILSNQINPLPDLWTMAMIVTIYVFVVKDTVTLCHNLRV